MTSRAPLKRQNRPNNVQFRGLESPGDGPSPGIQFTRGSFSTHLLSLESPPPTRGRGPTCEPSSTASIGLESPAHKRSPPVPSTLPRPPICGDMRRRTQSPIPTLPPPPPSVPGLKEPKLPVSPSGGGKRDDPQSSQVSQCVNVSVNPVDALVKKLRHQATELTKVYEQIEKKDRELHDLQEQVNQLTVRLEEQKSKLRPAKLREKGLKCWSKSGVGSGLAEETTMPRCTSGASDSCPPTHEDRSEVRAIQIQTVEEALRELRRFHLEFQEHKSTEQGSLGIADVEREQRLYIRVLEEAVHLKASELSITGHEELLVVLAELRRTIYQQEQEIGELQKLVNTQKCEVLSSNTARLQIEEELQREKTLRKRELVTASERESSLQHQLEEAQRLVHTEHMRFRQERVVQDEQAKRLAALEQDLAVHKQEIRSWETTRSDAWTRTEASLSREVEVTKASLEQERSLVIHLRDELGKSERQVQELQVLQEGLLESVDKFVSKEAQLEGRLKELQQDEEAAQRYQNENRLLQTTIDVLRDEILTLEKANSALQCRLRDFDTISSLNSDVRSALLTGDGTTITSDVTSEQLSIDRWVLALQPKLASVEISLPWLHELVTEMGLWSSRLRDDWNQLGQLRKNVKVLDEKAEASRLEIETLHVALMDTQSKLIKTELNAEKTQLRLSTAEEELAEARAQVQLGATLAEQIFGQENLLKFQQERLKSALEQNEEMVEVETRLTNLLDEKELQIVQLQHRLRQCLQQEAVLREVERELENAAALSEDQNVWNQQLTVELEHLELEKGEQDRLVEILENREGILSTSFTQLFTQYMQFVAASKQRLKDECAIGRLNQKLPRSTYDEALGSGDVLQMLRVFPSLVEDYLAGVMLSVHGQLAEQGRKEPSRKQKTRPTSEVLKLVDADDKNNQIGDLGVNRSRGLNQWQGEDEEVLGTQLREIAAAFNRFKLREPSVTQ